ncbi:hypothetical protein CEXT_785461 [Caerostris extrusa]|uniref:Uncharacterized protein n=1 Tax=Caerostris extrusa TaxID=172846 RepID=A0AAV4NWX9_CAEEX|nr:hypothetical protein CEXT_785461 [Caerostris extrusa]
MRERIPPIPEGISTRNRPICGLRPTSPTARTSGLRRSHHVQQNGEVKRRKSVRGLFNCSFLQISRFSPNRGKSNSLICFYQLRKEVQLIVV